MCGVEGAVVAGDEGIGKEGAQLVDRILLHCANSWFSS